MNIFFLFANCRESIVNNKKKTSSERKKKVTQLGKLLKGRMVDVLKINLMKKTDRHKGVFFFFGSDMN
jgi:ribosomal 50S subunit-associated protein YjgA (DUF615 family)